ncbi:MAG: glycosyltransferase family 4 protein [Caldilineaceae bacterium]|nr:glycosyltransferase family 4 protein [Caldilineaceae bacterium]
MRILHLIQRYWPAIGGAETHLHELSARLVEDGHEVTVATTDALDFEIFWDPRRRRVAKAQESRDGVQIMRFPVRHLPIPQLGYPAWRRLLWILSRLRPIPVVWMDYLARYTPYVPDLWRWLDETNDPFDLIAGMTICFEPFSTAGLRLARRRRIPFVVYPLTHLGAGRAPGEDALSRFYTMRHQVETVVQSDGLVAQTETERDFYLTRGLSPARAVVGGPGLHVDQLLGGDGERFRAQHTIFGPMVAAIGSMSADKGTVHTVEAVRHLWQQGHDVALVLAGAILSPFRAYLNRLPRADRERIHLLGPIEDSTKLDLLAAADLLAMPSRTDSFGIAYLEAWVYNKPVIGARAWGIDRLIEDGADGLLVPFGDIVALSDAIAHLLSDPDLRLAMGRAGRAKVEQCHTWSHKYQITAELYAQLVAR